MIDEKQIKRFIEGAKKAHKEVDDPTFIFPMNILSAYELAISIEELLKAQEPVKPKFIDGKRNHFILCGNCNTDLMRGMKFCSYCGKAVKWE